MKKNDIRTGSPLLTQILRCKLSYTNTYTYIKEAEFMMQSFK